MPMTDVANIANILALVVGTGALIASFLGVLRTRADADKSVVKAQRSLEDVEQQAVKVRKIIIDPDLTDGSVDHSTNQTRPSQNGHGIESADLLAAADLVKSSAEMSRRQLEDAGKDRKNAATQQAVYFAVSVISGLAGIGVFLYGAYLVLSGEASVGTITGLSSVIPITFTGLLFKRADLAEKRLDQNSKRTNENIERAESMLRVIQALARMKDSSQRERILAILSLRQMFPDATLAELAAIADHRAESNTPATVMESE